MNRYVAMAITVGVFVIGCVGRVDADVITLSNLQGDNYLAVWNDPLFAVHGLALNPGPTLAYEPGTPNRLHETLVLDNQPGQETQIFFIEDGVGQGDLFGLRLTMDISVTNNTGNTLTGFELELLDGFGDNSDCISNSPPGST